MRNRLRAAALLAGIPAVLIDAVPRCTWGTAVAAVASCGLAAGGIDAGVFIGDDPADPAFIHWVAAATRFVFIAAVLLFAVAAWGVLRPLPPVARIVLTAVIAIVGPVLLALVQLTAMPMMLLLALAAPVALIAVTLVTVRRRSRQVEA